jgi:hypothetical protein
MRLLLVPQIPLIQNLPVGKYLKTPTLTRVYIKVEDPKEWWTVEANLTSNDVKNFLNNGKGLAWNKKAR